MFLIGEFSKLTQISVRMLRYYDETGLLKPEKTDPMTGYRMYSAQQIPALNRIIYLRDSGFQVSEIAAALAQKDDAHLARMLDEKQKEIEKGIQEEFGKLKRIEMAREELLGGKTDMHYNICIKTVPSYPVLSLRRVIPDYYAEGSLWQELSDFALRNRIQVSDQTFSIYHDAEYKEQDVDVELCAPVKKLGESRDGFTYRMTEPFPTMACTMVYGPFSNIAGAYLAFAEWLQKNSRYQMSCQTRQIVHRGPWNEENAENYLTEVQIPLELPLDSHTM